MNMPPTRLYGEPGAEVLYRSLEAAAERAYDTRTWDDDLATVIEITMEEFTALHPGAHMPTSADIIEWIREQTGENGMTDSDCFDEISAALDSAIVGVLLDAAIQAVAEKVTYRMAGEHVSDRSVWLHHTPGQDPSFTFGSPRMLRCEGYRHATPHVGCILR